MKISGWLLEMMVVMQFDGEELSDLGAVKYVEIVQYIVGFNGLNYGWPPHVFNRNL